MWTKDPDARLDYTWNWTAWLVGDDTLDTATFTSTPVGLDIGTQVTDPAGLAVVMISGGTVGTAYSVTCHVVSAQGREDDKTEIIRICER